VAAPVPEIVDQIGIEELTLDPCFNRHSKNRKKKDVRKMKTKYFCKCNTDMGFLTWSIVIINSDREVPRHVGHWVPPFYCEVDTCVHYIQLRKRKTVQCIIKHGM
jgi:hypothetical protein